MVPSQNSCSRVSKHGKMHQAIRWQKRIFENEPDNYFILKDIGMNYLAMKDTDNALAIFKKILDMNPNIQSIRDMIDQIQQS